MGNLQIAQLKINRSAFINAAYLVTYMDKYSYYFTDEDKMAFDTYVYFSGGLPLPSGRWGNAIALALEVNNYVAAEYLIDNADRFELDTNTVASEIGDNCSLSLKDEYLYSQLTYKEEKIPIREGQSEEDYQIYVENFIKNKNANERLEKKLSITNEDKKIINK